MGTFKNADASYSVGMGISSGSAYKGFDGQKQIVVQLTADGATETAMDALNYLKTYAVNNSKLGLPIKPNAEVLISANGYTRALEADDFEVAEDGVVIGGIVYTASTDSWDFTNAMSGGGGGSTVSVTANYSQQTYNDELATITVDETETSIYAPKVSVTPTYESDNDTYSIGKINVGSVQHILYGKKFVVLNLEDNGEYIYINAYSITNLISQGSILAVGVYSEAQEGYPTYNIYYLDKYWEEPDPQDENNTLYHLKFGTRTYSTDATNPDVFVLEA